MDGYLVDRSDGEEGRAVREEEEDNPLAVETPGQCVEVEGYPRACQETMSTGHYKMFLFLHNINDIRL